MRTAGATEFFCDIWTDAEPDVLYDVVLRRPLRISFPELPGGVWLQPNTDWNIWPHPYSDKLSTSLSFARTGR
jgi:hypothetical protein